MLCTGERDLTPILAVKLVHTRANRKGPQAIDLRAFMFGADEGNRTPVTSLGSCWLTE